MDYLSAVWNYDAPKHRDRPHRKVTVLKCEPGFEDVKDFFQHSIESGNDLGASAAVYFRGKEVVRLVGGCKGGNPTDGNADPYSEDCLQMVFSSTKLLEAVCIAVCHDRGYLHYDDPIAKHWPEFAQNDKEQITVRDLMQHRAGLAVLDRRLSVEECHAENQDALGDYLAAQATNFEGYPKPFGYHATTRGLYVNQIIRRVDPKKRSIREFAKEEICDPLGIEFYIGLTELEHLKRVSPLTFMGPKDMFTQILPQTILPNAVADYFYTNPYNQMPKISKKLIPRLRDQNSYPRRALSYSIRHSETNFNKPVGQAVLGASHNGFSNAWSMARLAAMLCNHGEIDGVRILSEDTVVYAETIPEDHSKTLDKVLYRPVKYNTGGWGLFTPEIHGLRAKGWGGYGGSLILYDSEHDLAVGYAMTALGLAALGDHRGLGLVKAAQASVEKLKACEAG
eukprot:Clim_evm35s241 gene=Clim_evmTU35s241